MAKVPKKNIGDKLQDIRNPDDRGIKPAGTRRAPAEFPEIPANPSVGRVSGRRMPPSFIVRAAGAVLVLSVITIGVFSYIAYKNQGSGASGNIFKSASNSWPRLKSVFSSLKNIQGVTGNALSLSDKLNGLSEDAPELILTDRGEELMEKIDEIDSLLEKMETQTKEIQSVYLGSRGAGFVNSLDFSYYRGILEDLKVWAAQRDPRRLAVFLGNSSEMRPGGGFTGSYVEAEILQGAIHSALVRDINESDRLLGKKITPPGPLAYLVSSWRAADANWFADGPSSAEKTLEFLEKSKLYAGRKFDGAIIISPKVVEDLLDATGPISVDDKTILTHDNFLNSIQADVQESLAGHSPNPKSVLERALPVILEKLKKAKIDSRMAARMKTWIVNRDAVFYFRDEAIEAYARKWGAAGEQYPAGENFQGDFLQVAPANIGGQKSDAKVRQNIKYEATVGSGGILKIKVIIKRAHTADKSDAWWYNSPSKTYFKIYAPEGSEFESQQNFWKRTGIPLKISGAADSQLAQIEKTLEKFDGGIIEKYLENKKTVFGGWAKLNPGQEQELILAYSRDTRALPQNGKQYRFVIERSSASSQNYELGIIAPAGFVWKEKNAPFYVYKTSAMPGRFIVDLTLKKL